MPNPPAVEVILIMISHPQSEHLPFTEMVDSPGLASNIFLTISIMPLSG